MLEPKPKKDLQSHKPLSQLIKELGSSQSPSDSAVATDAVVKGLVYDSRAVTPGSVFFCIPGQKTDGNEHIPEAVAKGAVAIVSEKAAGDGLISGVPVIVVPNVRSALADAADFFFDHPSTRLRLLAVTGTNGKTTTTHLIEDILVATGKTVGLLGTLGGRLSKGTVEPTYQDIKHTTPQASDLQASLSEMLDSGASHVVMEVSSHALALDRVRGSHFAAAALTNITQDHLDFHKTMEHYWKTKRQLFEMLAQSSAKNRVAVINIDDPHAKDFLSAVPPGVSTLTYGWASAANGQKADFWVKDAQFDFSGTRLTLATPSGDLPMALMLNGHFNVYNVMAALAICFNEGVELSKCKEALEKFPGVAGRFDAVPIPTGKKAPLCLVDYAHTPDGLENVLTAARKLVPAKGKLVAVFGCGGDRDSSKRPQMGGIGETLADRVIVTSDNPRSEDPESIIADILAGVKRMANVTVECDRAAAINQAVEESGDDDVVVVAGKGHETYQILRDKTIHFDDREVIQKAILSRLAKAEKRSSKDVSL